TPTIRTPASPHRPPPSPYTTLFRSAAIVDAFERYRPTLFSGTPATYRILIDAGVLDRDLTSIRIWAGGADAFSDELITTFRDARSEEHTSELQSPCNLVCRLLLGKK